VTGRPGILPPVPRPTAPARAAALAATAAACALALAACGGGDDGGAAASAAATATAPSVVAGCSTAPPPAPAAPGSYDAPPPMTIDASRTYTATLRTSCGPIVVRLDARRAPTTVNNFVFLAREGFYDGLTFHRTVRGFVIQGGDPAGDGSGGPGYAFAGELPDDGYPAGAVAMANSGPGTDGSQFFIVTGDAGFLPNDYSRFGTVTSGMDAARRIEDLAPVDDPEADAPRQPAYILSVTVTES
jgi:cyclophilin family peptidyl-prolyl cis-trans isomerase